MYIYIYIYNSFKYPVRWQKLLCSARSGNIALSYRNSVITPGWRLMRAGYRTFFYMLCDEYIYIYIYIERESEREKKTSLFLPFLRWKFLSTYWNNRWCTLPSNREPSPTWDDPLKRCHPIRVAPAFFVWKTITTEWQTRNIGAIENSFSNYAVKSHLLSLA